MSRGNDKDSHQLDVYARPFVPQSLRNVNLAQAKVVQSVPAPWIDFDAYVQRFAGTDFLKTNSALSGDGKPQTERNDGESSRTNGQSLSPSTTSVTFSDGDLSQPSELAQHNYHDYFQSALKTEGAALRQECEDHALYRVAFLAPNPSDPRPSMYSLLVPGLRELSLRIEIGDIVQLRQLRFNQKGEVTYGSLIKDKDGNSIATPRPNDIQYNSTVWGIDRLKERLSLRIENFKQRSMLFNVRFTVQAERVRAVYTAVIAAQRALHGHTTGSWMRSMLFPESSDGYYQKNLNKAILDLELYDSLLNYEQLKAVNTVLNETYGPVPYIISGPPGTGKTKTIVELALQLIDKRKTTHLLICAPSDPAADTLIQRMSKHLKPSELLRINAPSRSFPEVPNSVLPFCCVIDGMFSLPPFEELMRCRAVVTTCRDAEILVKTRVSNADLLNHQQRLHAAIHPDRGPFPLYLHWTGLLVDEAAQATEPEALIPLSVVAPSNDSDIAEAEWPTFVMAGDQHQLGPRTASKTPTMQTSVFERLLERPFYRDHPLARSAQSGGIMRPLTQDMLPILRPASTNLIRNYRSHPAILATPSLLFYNDTLEPEAGNIDSLLTWPNWRGRKWPILFACNQAPDEIEQDGGGWYNINESKLACQYAYSFLQHGVLQPREICIMSPFRAQVRVLRQTARGAPFSMPAVNIGPLEAFQGLEFRLVILCTTRTRDRFLEQDIAKGLGVIHEPKRFNVALTRAKEGLIVIGNAQVLEMDENWRTFLAFCGRNGLVEDTKTGVDFPKGSEGVSLSRLERQLIHRDEYGREHAEELSNGVRKLGFAEDPEQGLWQSGVAAEMILRSEESD